MPKEKTEYIGDGVYARMDEFGGIWLNANHHEFPTDKIYLEPKVFESLNRFYKHQMEALNAHSKNRNNA